MNNKIIIIDFEATCVSNTDKDIDNEIIEFAAIKLGENGEIIDEFCEFVKPVINPTLSKYCTDLTTITQNQVDRADNFPEVYNRFVEWKEDYNIWGSWGKYDDNQLKFDCNIHGLEYPFTEHINLKVMYSKKYKTKRAGLIKALHNLNMTFEGTHHRGIDDCRNIHRIYLKIIGYTNEF